MLHTDQRFVGAVEAAVTRLEEATDAELVVVASPRSGSYRDISLLVGIATAALVLLFAVFAPVQVSPAWLPPELLLSLFGAAWVAEVVGQHLSAVHSEVQPDRDLQDWPEFFSRWGNQALLLHRVLGPEALRALLAERFGWALGVDFDRPEETHQFWYVSEDKLEPRLGLRREEPPFRGLLSRRPIRSMAKGAEPRPGPAHRRRPSRRHGRVRLPAVTGTRHQ